MSSQEFERAREREGVTGTAHALPGVAASPSDKDERICQLEARVRELEAELALQRKLGEEALQKSTSRFRNLAEALPQHVLRQAGQPGEACRGP